MTSSAWAQRLALAGLLLTLTACSTPRSSRLYSPPSTPPRVVPADRGTTAPAPAAPLTDGPPAISEIPPNLDAVPEPVPAAEPRSRYGNPPSYEVFGKTYRTLDASEGFRETGLASWYGRKFQGRKTSSGEPYDMFQLTAAHKTLPLPTYVRVTNLTNGKHVIVRVNDRGPFHDERIIDLSYIAATRLELLGGPAMVEIEALTPGAPMPPPIGPLDELAHAPAGTPNYLQVAAYSDPRNADALKRELVKLGVRNVEFRSGDFHGAAIQRVVVGPYADAAKLGAMRQKLSAGGYPSIPVRY